MLNFLKKTSAVTTIFVVDDELLILELSEALLTPLECRVVKFTDPELALKEFAQAAPKLVITDYAMGRMTGMDLIRECRRLNPQQKIILVSGTVDGGVFANAAVKPDAFIAKPYQPEKLVDIVRQLIAT